MTATYLSVDLDYWGTNVRQRGACTRFFNKLLSLDVPILVVKDHHHILDDVNNSRCSRIEHVDYHADLSDRPNKVKKLGIPSRKRDLFLNCGTWLNFVKWRKRGTLVWRYPTDASGTRLGGCYLKLDPFRHAVSDWPNPRKKLGLRGLPWDDVARIGVAISEDWWHDCGETYESILPRLLGMKKRDTHWHTQLSKKSFQGFRRRLR